MASKQIDLDRSVRPKVVVASELDPMVDVQSSDKIESCNLAFPPNDRLEDRQLGEDDIEAIRDSCDNIALMIKNFNMRKHSLPEAARNCVDRLNENILHYVNSGHKKENGTDSQNSKFHNVRDNAEDNISVHNLANLFSKFDTRSVPKPEVYDSDSGQKFEEFLILFEEYCRCNFKSSSVLWIGELGRLLTGSMHQAFQALRIPGDSYETVKSKLIKWNKDMQQYRYSSLKNRFHAAEPLLGEPLRLYAARLEKAFRLANPGKDVEGSNSLRDKFSQSVPISFQRQLVNLKNMHVTMTGKSITWNTILTLASCYDSDNVENFDEGMLESSNVYAAQVGIGKTDAVTQCEGSPLLENRYLNNYNSSRYRSETDAKNSVNRVKVDVAEDYSKSRESRECFYCKKKGHIKSNCWKFNRLCLACGQQNHQIANCPNRRDFKNKVGNVFNMFDRNAVNRETRFKTGADVNVGKMDYYGYATNNYSQYGSSPSSYPHVGYKNESQNVNLSPLANVYCPKSDVNRSQFNLNE